MGRPRKVVQVPGVVAAPDAPADDLAAFESDTLPPMDAASAAQIALAAEQAARKRLERRVAELEKKPELDNRGRPQPEVFSTEEAMRLAAADVAAGKRPRSRLTPTGWYVHPEAARVAAPVI